MAEQGDVGGRGADGGERGDDRQEGRGERPEGEEEDDGGGAEPDDFRQLGAWGLGQRDPGAAQFDLQTVAGGGLRGVDDPPDLARVQLVGGGVEDQGGVGGVPVLADPARAPPVVGAVDPGDAGEVGDLLQGARHRPLDRAGAHGRGSGAPHDAVAVAALPREALRQQRGRLPGLGAGDLVVVGVRGAHQARGVGDPREGGEPQDDHH